MARLVAFRRVSFLFVIVYGFDCIIENISCNNILSTSILHGRTGGFMKKSHEDRATYKVPEAARVAGVGSLSIYKGIAAGTIPHIRFGRNILIPKHAFHEWLDTCGAGASLNTQRGRER